MIRAIIVSVLIFSMATSTVAQKQRTNSPNIIYILADDLGIGDLSIYNENSKIQTPHLDALGADGMVFTDAHTSSSVCTPTRYGILTGRYNWRTPLKEFVTWGNSPMLIDHNRWTVADLLKKYNYKNGVIGKWHLGLNWDVGESEHSFEKFSGITDRYDFKEMDYSKPLVKGALDVGFDYSYLLTASLNMPPYVYIENDKVVTEPKAVSARSRKEHPYAHWIKGDISNDFDHEQVLPVFVNKSISFIKENADGEQPFFLYLPLPAPHNPILPIEPWAGKSGINPYADFVIMIDDLMGEIVRAVEESGIEENTLIIFTSDNGCAANANFSVLAEHGHNPNYIYSGSKGSYLEGGHRVPFLVKWPQKIKPKSICSETICTTDFMATCADIVDYTFESNEAEDSYSMLPLFAQESGYERRETIHHSKTGIFAIRQGDWKLIVSPNSGINAKGQAEHLEKQLPEHILYNLKLDIGEKENVAEKYPEKVAELKQLLIKRINEGRSTPGEVQKNDDISVPWVQAAFAFEGQTKNTPQRTIHPYWAPKTIQLRADDVTTIMGFRALLEGNLNHADRPTPTVVNNAFIRGFITENDIMTWTVDAPEEDNYSVALLYTGSKAILSHSSLEVTSGNATIIEKVNVPNWETRPVVQRHSLKQQLRLKKGINEISFRLVNFQGTEQEREAVNNTLNDKGKTNPFALWSIELVRPETLSEIKTRAQSTKADVQWMVDGKYGLFVHFSSGSVPFYGGPKLGDQYQKMVDAFDIDAFVEKVVETGASWVTFTCAHGTQHWPGPSKTIDRVKPGFTCERDLIRELIDGLAKHDIRLMLYYNPNSGMEDLYGNTYGNGDTPDPTGYFTFLEAHFREVSLRYGEDLATTAGYIDDCGWKVYQLDPPWEKFAKAIRAGNPNAPIGFSQNLFPSLTPFSDLVVSDGAGRVPEIQPAFLFEEGGQLEGQHPASWFYMDAWSSRTGKGVFTQTPKFSAEEYIEIFKKADEANMPITINLAMTPDVTKEQPFFNPVCIDIMKQVRKAVKGY